MKIGALYTHNYILDGFSAGANEGSGQFQFDGRFSGNGFSDFLLGLPFRSNAQINTRGGRPLEATASEFAAFVQDDWKVNSHLTLFLGLRYELLGNFAEKNDLLINFDPASGSLVVPNDGIKAFLAPDAQRTVPVVTASQFDLPRTLVNTDKNNVSPRVGFAYRLGEDSKTVIRGGTGLFYPTQAAQGIRDALSRSPFRYSVTRNNPVYTSAFSTGQLVTDAGLRRERGGLRSRERRSAAVQRHARTRADQHDRHSRHLHGQQVQQAAREPRHQHGAAEHDSVRSERSGAAESGCRIRISARR